MPSEVSGNAQYVQYVCVEHESHQHACTQSTFVAFEPVGYSRAGRYYVVRKPMFQVNVAVKFRFATCVSLKTWISEAPRQ